MQSCRRFAAPAVRAASRAAVRPQAARPAVRAYSVARPAAAQAATYWGAALAAGAATSYYLYQRKSLAAAEVPRYGVPGTNQERTFIAIKPDGVQRNLIGEIIKRFESRGYKLVGLKMLHPTLKMAQTHYQDLSHLKFYPGLCKYFSSGPIVCMVWEGADVIKQGRKLVGATNPNDSEAGSIRGDLCISIGRNIIHGSDAPDSAQHEISMWFTDEEISNYDLALHSWIYER